MLFRSVNKERLYFFLTPLNETGTKLYVPADKADNGLRRVITEDEAWQFIDKIPKIAEAWITDDKQREQKYKEAIQSCDPEKLMSIIKNMYARMQKRTAQGKRAPRSMNIFLKLRKIICIRSLRLQLEKTRRTCSILLQKKLRRKSERKKRTQFKQFAAKRQQIEV